jgi:hypothetical protein
MSTISRKRSGLGAISRGGLKMYDPEKTHEMIDKAQLFALRVHGCERKAGVVPIGSPQAAHP